MAHHTASGMDVPFEFSPATEEDYEGVMAISGDVYRGMDYLPLRYHSWLKEANRRMFVVKRQGQVVAMHSFYIVDDGRTAVGEGLRVAPSEQGKGVAGLLMRFMNKYLKTELPAVKVARLSRVEDPPASMLKQYRLLHSKAVLSLIFNATDVQETVQALISRIEKEGQHFQVPITLGPEQVRNILLNEAVIERLLPARMLIQSWLPVLPLISNLDYLIAKGVTWMVDNAEDPTFLSLGTPPFKVPLTDNAHRFDINLYGMDPRSATMHFVAQLLAVKEVTQLGTIVCCMYMEKPLFPTLDLFCEGMKRYDGLWKEQLVMETDI